MKISIIGAGVMGMWSAYKLLDAGHQVNLYEAYYPGHTRSSSGGESRLIRGIYGKDDLYMDWVQYSLEQWQKIESKLGNQLFYPVGCLWMFGNETAYGDYAFDYLKKIDWPIDSISLNETRNRFPQFSLKGIHKTYYEPNSGYLMARLGCQLIKKLFVQAGGTYIQEQIPVDENRLEDFNYKIIDHDSDFVVLACGPWLKSLLKNLLGNKLMISRQEIYYFSLSAPNPSFNTSSMPAWIDLSERNYYGIPFTDQRGFKMADDSRLSEIDLEEDDRLPTPKKIEAIKDYMRLRFPTFTHPKISEARVCQYTNTTDGNFIIDFHPQRKDILIIGGGSGHAFKLGPSIGSHVTQLVSGQANVNPMFSLDRFNDSDKFQSQFKR